MSVVVRGMKMPKRCDECEFAQDDSWYGLHCTIQTDEDGWLMDVSSIETDRHPDCPLVELPSEHGRLIDADAQIVLTDAHGREIEVTVSHIIERNGGEVVSVIEAESEDV